MEASNIVLTTISVFSFYLISLLYNSCEIKKKTAVVGKLIGKEIQVEANLKRLGFIDILYDTVLNNLLNLTSCVS